MGGRPADMGGPGEVGDESVASGEGGLAESEDVVDTRRFVEELIPVDEAVPAKEPRRRLTKLKYQLMQS